ncbi:hypothetical protein ABPG72_011860 [Tetrahymena utriculariae]
MQQIHYPTLQNSTHSLNIQNKNLRVFKAYNRLDPFLFVLEEYTIPYKIPQNFEFSELQKEEFQNKNLKQRLQRAFKIILDQKMGIDINILDENEIYQSLIQCFQNKDNNLIAANILKLYTQETKFYKYLNSLLCVLNQDLIIIFWDIILCFRTALNIYDDSKFSAIQLPQKNSNQEEEIKVISLYRGELIPKDVFDYLYKPNQYISMCGFSSFSTKIDTALQFHQGCRIRVIFKVDFQCGIQQYPLRPKCLIELSDCDEEEYLISCGTQFKTKSIYEKKDNHNDEIKYVELIL